MAALTYGFSQLGPHPLDAAFASERDAFVTEAPREAAAEPTPPPAEAKAEVPVAESAPSVAPLPAEPAAVAMVDEAPAVTDRPRASDDEPAPVEPGPSPNLAGALPSDPESARRELPEFTDGAKPPSRERAADGPRLDSLFPRADASSDVPKADAAAPPATADARPTVALTSCEAAIAKNGESLEIGGPRGPADITREAYASILQNGQYLAGCSLPERTVFEICAAVKNGRAVGVTVVSSPNNGELNACVKRAVSRLAFPSSERLDVTHTRFDAVKR